jgi:hypothetical protein
LVQPPPPRGASSLRRRSPYARTTHTPHDAAIRHFCAAAVPEPRARRGRATGGAARRSAVAIAMAGEATGGACWASTGPCAAGVAPCCGWRRKGHDALFAFPENTHVDWARRTCEASIDGRSIFWISTRLASPARLPLADPRASDARAAVRPPPLRFRVPSFASKKTTSFFARSFEDSRTKAFAFGRRSRREERRRQKKNLGARRRCAPPPPPRLTSPATCARTARPSS